MPGQAHCDGVATSRDDIGNASRLPEQQRQWAGPEALGESASCRGNFDGYLCDHFQAFHMNDERIPCRSLFGGEDARNRSSVESIGSESIDSFGGNGYQSAALENGCTLDDRRMREIGFFWL